MATSTSDIPNFSSLRQLQVFVEPTEYILDLIEEVYTSPRTTCVFAFNRKTLASLGTTAYPILSQMPILQRVLFVRKALRTHDAVAIHSYTDPISILVLFLNLFWRRVVTFEVDSAWREPRSRVIAWAKQIWLGFWFSRPYVWGCAIGAEVHRQFFLRHGLPKERLLERPNVVKFDRFARKEPKPTKNSFCFGFVGRLVRHKEVSALVEAFRVVVRRFPNASLSIVGDGPEREALINQAADLPQIVFHGAVFGEAKIALQHAMDALCLVSSYEPWGLVVNELLAAGTPCIVSDVCGCVEPLIAGPQAGLVVPVGNHEALVKAMCSLIENPHEAQAMGARGCAFVRDVWNYNRYRQCLNYFR